MSATFAFLTGKRIYLRPLLPEDCQGSYPRWFNDEEVCAGNSHHVFPYTPNDAESYIRGLGTASDTIALAIVVAQNNEHIGNISLQRIDLVNRCADLAIVIGEKTSWHQGYATESSRLLCSHGFETLNLHRITCGTFHNNEAMKKLAISLGMKEEGRRREAAFKDGRYLDVIEYGVLRAEYEGTREDEQE
jgi:RimJ/RimL family protein N-acetyltransferase